MPAHVKPVPGIFLSDGLVCVMVLPPARLVRHNGQTMAHMPNGLRGRTPGKRAASPLYSFGEVWLWQNRHALVEAARELPHLTFRQVALSIGAPGTPYSDEVQATIAAACRIDGLDYPYRKR